MAFVTALRVADATLAPMRAAEAATAPLEDCARRANPSYSTEAPRSPFWNPVESSFRRTTEARGISGLRLVQFAILGEEGLEELPRPLVGKVVTLNEAFDGRVHKVDPAHSVAPKAPEEPCIKEVLLLALKVGAEIKLRRETLGLPLPVKSVLQAADRGVKVSPSGLGLRKLML
ncbi:MAG TPA: hypothetical protein VLT87_10970 [Thermoanaerobaculia bacterium]|nr:hypothetical protein [Thermoanaerobaculia bacterium]